MDLYGIGSAMRAMVRVYLQTAKASGRTTTLIDSLKDGDRVIVMTGQDKDEILRLCRERGIDIKCIIIDPKKQYDIFSHGTSQGRTIFDHRWVEQYYMDGIEGSYKDIDLFQERLSGYGKLTEKTKRQAIEGSKWGFL